MVRAALGQREEDDGTTCPIEPDQAGAARRQAVWIVLWSAALAVVGAAVAWLMGALIGRSTVVGARVGPALR